MRKVIGLGIVGLVTAALFMAPPAAMASSAGLSSSTDVTVSGSWGSAHYRLDLSRESGGKIESDLNLTKGVNGQKWNIRMKDNGVRFFKGSRTVRDHEWEAKGYATNQSGPDVIKIIATNTVTGKTYYAKATF